MTPVLQTARISNIDSVLYADEHRKISRPSFTMIKRDARVVVPKFSTIPFSTLRVYKMRAH